MFTVTCVRERVLLLAGVSRRLVWVAGLAIAMSWGQGANWPQWRGPEFNGSTSEAGLPESFSRTEQVVWNVELPGSSAATPAVWGDRVFLNSADEDEGLVLGLCLDVKTGAELWRVKLETGTHRDNRSNYASPSPITDGKHVWFYTSTGELVALDVEGQEVWRRNIQKDYGEFAFQWTYASSPLLYGDRLYVQVLQRDVPVNGRGRADGPNDSYILCLEPLTGKEIWRHVRPSKGVAEAREAYSTPLPVVEGGRSEFIIVGGDCITGHDLASGEELWRWGTWNPRRIGHYRLVPSPVAGGGVVLACGPKGEPIFAAPLGKSGVLKDEELAWVSTERAISADVPTPLFYRGHFYVLDGNRKALSCVEPASGKVLWTGEFESRVPFEASPTGADGRVYCINHRGEVFVVKAQSGGFELVAQVEMGDESDRDVRASIVAAQGRLFIRTNSRLYCLGE
ncbi:MAG: hypothetical protein RI897_1711 [Verrucomicrobiota bacterium]